MSISVTFPETINPDNIFRKAGILNNKLLLVDMMVLLRHIFIKYNIGSHDLELKIKEYLEPNTFKILDCFEHHYHKRSKYFILNKLPIIFNLEYLILLNTTEFKICYGIESRSPMLYNRRKITNYIFSINTPRKKIKLSFPENDLGYVLNKIKNLDEFKNYLELLRNKYKIYNKRVIILWELWIKLFKIITMKYLFECPKCCKDRFNFNKPFNCNHQYCCICVAKYISGPFELDIEQKCFICKSKLNHNKEDELRLLSHSMEDY